MSGRQPKSGPPAGKGGGCRTWHGLELSGQQRLVRVEDSSVGNDHGGTDVDFLLSLHDTHAWKQSRSKDFICLSRKRRKFKPTTGFSGAIEQDAVHWCSDQNRPSCLLNDGDHVIGDFSGSAFRVPGAVEVVGDQQTVHGEAGVFRHVACRSEQNPMSVRSWSTDTDGGAPWSHHRCQSYS